MDKNMIKIDDLLRQRLGDAEEQERAGAWGNMRDLLDKQMPVSKVPAATNWRRMFAYVAGVALLATLSVGGYQMSQSFNSTGDGAGEHIAANRSKTPATGLAGTAVENSLPDGAESINTQPATAPVADVADNAVTTAPANTHSSSTTANTGTQSATTHKAVTKDHIVAAANTNVAATNKLNAADAAKTEAPVANNKTAASAATTQPVVASNSNSTTAPVAANKSAATNNTMNNTPANNNGQGMNNVAKTTTKNNTNDNKNNTKESPVEKLATNNSKSNAVTTTQPDPQFKDVPYQKTVIHEKTASNGKTVKDTIFNGEDMMKVRVPDDSKQALAMNNADDNNSGSNMMPSSAAPSAKNDAGSQDSNNEKLGQHNQNRNKNKNFNPSRFEEMVHNAKFRMGAVKFYPGIVAGANAAFNGNYGFHAGLAGNLAVSERWSILAETKFMFKFNNNHVNMQDDYINNVEPTVINGQSVYKYDSMEHYFNFNSYMGVDVPVLITYTKDKFTFMAGADLRYNFGINSIQEVEKKYLSEKEYYSTSEPKFETEPNVLLSDFGSSLNIGPMLGFGYQVAQGKRLDFRISQPLWNNSKNSDGRKQIFKELYGKTQFQVNLTFKLSNNKPYKRNK
ncbi:MAG: hypothetical protein H6550_12205 [Chitinophagales bacterium]|nr:hypothetical protein [Chitinophagales bacterium]